MQEVRRASIVAQVCDQDRSVAPHWLLALVGEAVGGRTRESDRHGREARGQDRWERNPRAGPCQGGSGAPSWRRCSVGTNTSVASTPWRPVVVERFRRTR